MLYLLPRILLLEFKSSQMFTLWWCRWVRELWNSVIANHVQEAVTKGTGSEAVSYGQSKVANTTLYVLMQKAIVVSCPVPAEGQIQHSPSISLHAWPLCGIFTCTYNVWELGQLVGTAPDSWWKGCEFESFQEWQENFFSGVNFLCWLIWCPFRPVFLQWHIKDSGHSAKRAGGSLHLDMCTPLTQWSQSRLTMLSRYSVGTYQGNELTYNSSGNTQSQSSQLD